MRDADVCEALTNRLRVACTLSELRALGRSEEGDGDDLASWTMKTMALLELEREAEEAQAQEILRGLSPEAAARRGARSWDSRRRICEGGCWGKLS